MLDNSRQELQDLAAIYRIRGLSSHLAQQVAEELTEKDLICAHARNQLVQSSAPMPTIGWCTASPAVLPTACTTPGATAAV